MNWKNSFYLIAEKDLSTPVTENSTDSVHTADSSGAATPGAGEGGTTGDFLVDRSVVFATLEAST